MTDATMLAATPAHQFVHNGYEVLILKRVGADGVAHGGFVWPLTVGAAVEAPDWDDRAECGGGLHGWPWGLARGDGKKPDYPGTWLVFGARPEDVVDIDGKCKARRGVVRYVGDWIGAWLFVLPGQNAWVRQAARGAASATGYRGAASATGYSGAANATGDSGVASATGDRGAASATGDSGAAVVTGLDGRAQSGPFGCIALGWWNEAAGRIEMRCAEVGCGDGSDGKLKALTWYRLDEGGAFVECGTVASSA